MIRTFYYFSKMELPKILLAIASNIFPLTKLMILFRKWKFLDVQSRINCSSNHRRIQVGGLKSNLLFGQNLPKTARKWRKSDQEREGSVSKILLCRSASCNYNSCFHVWRESTRVGTCEQRVDTRAIRFVCVETQYRNIGSILSS